MKSWIVCVGDEVLQGKVINTNASFIASSFEKIGIETTKVITIGDVRKDIHDITLDFLKSNEEIMITTGGLGPTHDDFTKEVISETLELPLVINPQAKQDLFNYFQEEKTDSNLKQIYYPQGCKMIPNPLGTADGFILEVENEFGFPKIIIVLVGVPFEMERMLQDTVLPFLESKGNKKLVQEYIAMGNGESYFENLLLPLVRKFQTITVAPYCSPGKIRYQITADQNEEKEFNQCKKEFENIMSSYIISKTNQEIEEVIVEELRKRHWTISFAESCTGGLLASTIVNVSGASEVFKESIVTYSEEAKQQRLHVNLKTIETYTVVSPQVVLEMVNGLRNITQSDVSISVSGYAGPSGDKGRVCYAIDIQGKQFVDEKRFQGDRSLVRLRATRWILYQLFTLLKES